MNFHNQFFLIIKLYINNFIQLNKKGKYNHKYLKHHK